MARTPSRQTSSKQVPDLMSARMTARSKMRSSTLRLPRPARHPLWRCCIVIGLILLGWSIRGGDPR